MLLLLQLELELKKLHINNQFEFNNTKHLSTYIANPEPSPVPHPGGVYFD